MRDEKKTSESGKETEGMGEEENCFDFFLSLNFQFFALSALVFPLRDANIVVLVCVI